MLLVHWEDGTRLAQQRKLLINETFAFTEGFFSQKSQHLLKLELTGCSGILSVYQNILHRRNDTGDIFFQASFEPN